MTRKIKSDRKYLFLGVALAIVLILFGVLFSQKISLSPVSAYPIQGQVNEENGPMPPQGDKRDSAGSADNSGLQEPEGFIPICTRQELSSIRNDLSNQYRLVCDIDLNESQFEPIGELIYDYGNNYWYGDCFTGVFDGNGHYIANLYYSNIQDDGVGLFACTDGASVYGVTLVEPRVEAYHLVGGLSGLAYHSTLTNNKVIRGDIKGTYRIGGLSGSSDGTITESSSSSADVSASGYQAGGLYGVSGRGSQVISSFAKGNVYAKEEGAGGLIGSTFDTGIADSYAIGIVNSNGIYVGGLTGVFYGSDPQTPVLSNSYATGDVVGKNLVGGLVGGGWYGKITGSYASGDVSVVPLTNILQSSGLGLGGLIGDSVKGVVENSYAKGNVNGVEGTGGFAGRLWSYEVTNVYSTGRVQGSYYTGGLIGYIGIYDIPNVVTSSYWDVQTSGQQNSDAGIGKTTAQMKQQSTFVGWNFESMWRILEGRSYPFFRWQR